MNYCVHNYIETTCPQCRSRAKAITPEVRYTMDHEGAHSKGEWIQAWPGILEEAIGRVEQRGTLQMRQESLALRGHYE